MTRIVVKCWVPFICALILHSISVTCPSIAGGDFKQALPGYKFRFPQDHFSHPDFKLEWWYYTGNLHTAYGKGFGYELTFFRVGLAKPNPSRASRWTVSSIYLAHLALTDKTKGRFFYQEKISRGSLDQAGAAIDKYYRLPDKALGCVIGRGCTNRYYPLPAAFPRTLSESLYVWIDDWKVLDDGKQHILVAGDSQLGLNLRLRPVKPPVIHGENGVSRKAEAKGHASHYYSMARLATNGVISYNGTNHKVTGSSWMDHEFGSNQLTSDQAGWDWFGLQLDNRHELMLYVIRQKDGSWNPVSSGTLVFPDSRTRHLGTGDFKIQKKGEWRSPHSGTVYPAGWTVTVPSEEILLEIMPAIADQELVTENSARVTYWEGSVNIKGRMHRKSLTGQGYVELTGYAPGGIGPALRKE